MIAETISVIVPVYNAEKYLDRCVESIVAQTYKNLEIILVDDGSTDNSPAICDAWAKKDSRIRVIHKKNGGVSSARNAGLDACTGDYIGFADADDWMEPDMYEVLIGNAKDIVRTNHRADIFITVNRPSALRRRLAGCCKAPMKYACV